MKWNVQLCADDFSAYGFVAADGNMFSCKYNRGQGSIRMKYNEHHGVLHVDSNHIIHRKFGLSNVYGSEIGMVTRNLWHENTGHIIFNEPANKLNYKIDSYSSLIQISGNGTEHICELQNLPHPGRESHYMPIVIALAWMHNVPTGMKVENASLPLTNHKI